MYKFDSGELLNIFRGDIFVARVVKDHQDIRNRIIKQDQAYRRWSFKFKKALSKLSEVVEREEKSEEPLTYWGELTGEGYRIWR